MISNVIFVTRKAELQRIQEDTVMKFINHPCQHCDYHYVGKTDLGLSFHIKTCMNGFIKFISVTNVNIQLKGIKYERNML